MTTTLRWFGLTTALALAGAALARAQTTPPFERAVSYVGRSVLDPADLVVQADVTAVRAIAGMQVVTVHITRFFKGGNPSRALTFVAAAGHFVAEGETELLLALRREQGPGRSWLPLGKTTLSDPWRNSKLECFQRYVTLERIGDYEKKRAALLDLIVELLNSRDAWMSWNAAGEAYHYCREHLGALRDEGLDRLAASLPALKARKPYTLLLAGLQHAWKTAFLPRWLDRMSDPEAAQRVDAARRLADAARLAPELFTARERALLRSGHDKELDDDARAELRRALEVLERSR